jgi:hypothetical protein
MKGSTHFALPLLLPIVLCRCNVSAWVQLQRLDTGLNPVSVHSTDAFRGRNRVRFAQSQDENEPSPMGADSTRPISDLSGKTLYQRVFYRFSPGSDVEIHDSIVVEERVRFEPDPSKGEDYIRPVGPRTLILRDGDVEDGEIGDDFFTLDVHDSLPTHRGAGKDAEMEGTIATALYLASTPSLCQGQVLEVACDMGLASLLGAIGAGYVTRKRDGSLGTKKKETDEILTVPSEFDGHHGLLPDKLECLTLTDRDEERLNLAFRNVKDSGVKASKVTIDALEWSVRRPQPFTGTKMKEYYTIVTSDVAFTYPEAKELARTVANRLEPSSPYISSDRQLPRFVHVCPDVREDVAYLHRLCDKGYRMSVLTGYLKVEKLAFVLQSLDSLKSEEYLDDIELELQEFKETVYQSLTATHHPDYAGEGSGELFFPVETGEYDGAGGSAYLEREGDRGVW